MNITETISHIWQRRELLWFLVYSDFKTAYHKKFFGFLWIILDPLLMMSVYLLLVCVIFKRGGPYFPILLFCSLLFWKCFTSSLSDSVVSITSRGSLVQSVNFPKAILPFSKVILNFSELTFGLVVLLPFLFLFKAQITWNILWLPCLMLIQFVFTLGLALSFSLTGVYFRDFQNILRYILRIWFYFSPVLYSVGDRVPAEFRVIYMLNPFASILESCKNIFVWGKPVDSFIVWAALLAFISLFFGLWIFQKLEPKVAKNV